MALTPPPEMKEIEKELDGSSARRNVPGGQEFEKAASLREKEKVLRHRDEGAQARVEKNKGKGTQSSRKKTSSSSSPLDRHPAPEARGERSPRSSPDGRGAARPHHRQNDAVAAVARAIRRSRAA